MSSMVDELTFTPEASATRYLFYQGFNDINLFVEDTGMEYVYETIFKRLMGNEYSITAIFSLGGKKGVIEKYFEFGDSTGQVKNIYIVDGDFDRYIYSDNMVSSPAFIYLDSYNIENYFIDKDACEQFAKGRLKTMDDEVARKVDFDGWKDKIVSQAKELFLCYCFVQKHQWEQEKAGIEIDFEKTVDRSPYLFIDCKTGFKRLDGEFEKYKEHVYSLTENVEQEIDQIAKKYEEINGTDYYNLICGKFLLCSLYCHLRRVIGEKFQNRDFMWHLINNFNISQLQYIKDAILVLIADKAS